jgi:hypothetical protein
LDWDPFHSSGGFHGINHDVKTPPMNRPENFSKTNLIPNFIFSGVLL